MLKNIFKVAVSNFLGAGLGFLVNVLLARCMSVKDFGQYNFIVSIIFIFFTVGEFGFGNTVVIYYNKLKAANGDDELLAVLSRFFLKCVILIFVIFTFLTYLTGYLYNLKQIEIITILLSVITFIIYRYCLAVEQSVGKWTRYNALNVLNNVVKGSIYLTGFIVIFIQTGKLFETPLSYGSSLRLYVIYSFILAGFALAYSLYPILKKRNNVSPEITLDVHDFWRYLWPIGVSNICIIISMRIDPIILKSVLGEASVGYYSVANSFAMMFPLITGALMNVMLKEISSNNLTLHTIVKRQKQFLPYIFMISVIAFFACKPIILLLFGMKYYQSIGLFRILMVAFIGGIFFTPLESYFYSHNMALVLRIRIAQMIVIILLSYFGVKYLGLIGVGISALTARCLAWVYFSLLSKRELARLS